MPTKIEWVRSYDWSMGETLNPIVGCTKVSAGCKNCYAETVLHRFQPWTKFTALQFHPERLEAARKRKKPTAYFICSMSDLFQKGVPDLWIEEVFQMIVDTPRHFYFILTKRPERLVELYTEFDCKWPDGAWRKNVMFGVSVEDEKTAHERILILNGIPNIWRWISYEPALGPLTIEPGGLLDNFSWVVAGGETGHGARPPDPEGLWQIERLCSNEGIPFFFKKWGPWFPYEEGPWCPNGNKWIGGWEMSRRPSDIEESGEAQANHGRLIHGKRREAMPGLWERWTYQCRTQKT